MSLAVEGWRVTGFSLHVELQSDHLSVSEHADMQAGVQEVLAPSVWH